MFCAVVLNKPSQNKLVREFWRQIPCGWSLRAHHMTIQYGENINYENRLLAANKTPWELTATQIGMASGRVIAVRISDILGGWLSENEIPHITLAVAAGAKAQESNQIRNWKPLAEPISLAGRVEIIK